MGINRLAENLKRRFFQKLVNMFFCGTHFFFIKRVLLRFSGIKVGSGTKIVGPIYSSAFLEFGNDCWIGRNMNANGNGRIIIGDKCDLAPDVMFLTGSHKIGNTARRAGEGESYVIHVNDGCWIGARVTILGNTTIGPGSVVGTCSLVNNDLTSNILAVGVPAKMIGRICEDGQIQLLKHNE